MTLTNTTAIDLSDWPFHTRSIRLCIETHSPHFYVGVLEGVAQSGLLILKDQLKIDSSEIA